MNYHLKFCKQIRGVERAVLLCSAPGGTLPCYATGWHPGFTVWNLLNDTRIENAHKVHEKTFVFHYMAVICASTEGTEHIPACVNRYDQSAWTSINHEARNDAHIASTCARLY